MHAARKKEKRSASAEEELRKDEDGHGRQSEVSERLPPCLKPTRVGDSDDLAYLQ